MKFLNFKKVLILAPHPDDAEYSVSGTVMKYKDTHFDILCLTKGGELDITTQETYRIEEVKNSWKKSQTSNFSLKFTPINYLHDKPIDWWITYIENTFDMSSYNCILTPSEYDSHFEHILVSGLGPPLVRSHGCGIIQYKSPSTLDTWIPNLFVSIDDFLNTKKEMLLEFSSQLHRPYFNNNTLNGFHTHFQCMKKQKGYVEMFKIITTYE